MQLLLQHLGNRLDHIVSGGKTLFPINIFKNVDGNQHHTALPRFGNPGIYLPDKIGPITQTRNGIDINTLTQFLSFIGLLFKLHSQLAGQNIDRLHHLFQFIGFWLGDGMTKMVQLNFNCLLTNLLKRLQQEIEGSHQQDGRDQEANHKPGRQLAHPDPKLVISLPWMAYHLEFA